MAGGVTAERSASPDRTGDQGFGDLVDSARRHGQYEIGAVDYHVAAA